MKEKELIALGFKKVTPDPEDWEGEEWYYYTYDFGNGSFSLITEGSNEIVDGKWTVEVFEDESIRFTNSSDVMGLIDVINRNTIKTNDST